MQTNVKLSLNLLTPPTQHRPTSHPTLTQLSLFRFRKKFVPLPTLKRAIFAPLLHFLIYCFTNYSIIMGKVTSLYGKTTGKIGSIVFSTSGGETIAREYNPNVANPSTKAQVNQRARMKLMSQLSASLAPVIVIPKEGLKSSRNLFVKKNFGASMASNGVAQISYENVQLTAGNAGIPQIVATRNSQSGVTIQLADSADASISRVVYIMYRKTSDQTLQLVGSIIVSSAGGTGTFPGTLPYTEGDIILYAYGMKDLNAQATARYGNLQVANALDIARLSASRSLSSSDYQYTETRGATMYADENEITPVPEGSARVFVTATSGGSVSGGGVFVIGQSATVVATPAEGYVFQGWALNGSVEILSTSASYTFEVTGQTDLVASFAPEGGQTSFRVIAQPASTGASVGTQVRYGSTTAASVTAIVDAGQQITFEAVQGTAEGVTFFGWRWDDEATYVSTSQAYTFIPNKNGTLIAVWQQGGL